MDGEPDLIPGKTAAKRCRLNGVRKHMFSPQFDFRLCTYGLVAHHHLRIGYRSIELQCPAIYHRRTAAGLR